MTRGEKIALLTGAAIVAAGALMVVMQNKSPEEGGTRPVSISGAVLREDSDPRKQVPIVNAMITIRGGQSAVQTRSDSAGYFHALLKPGIEQGDLLNLTLTHAEYMPLALTSQPPGKLFIARMRPLPQVNAAKNNRPVVKLKNLRVRYTVKTPSLMNVGFAVNPFVVENKGDVPCAAKQPCSPDGKWKASVTTVTLDAGVGNEFRTARVSCIAGPCPYTKVETSDIQKPARYERITVRDWSDTATFLFEAEVTHTMISDMVRESYPVIFGQAMNFSLPGSAEGPSIEADLNGQEIVFPLGPELILSWGTCEVEVSPDRTHIYRCQLKEGYEF